MVLKFMEVKEHDMASVAQRCTFSHLREQWYCMILYISLWMNRQSTYLCSGRDRSHPQTPPVDTFTPEILLCKTTKHSYC